MVPDSGADAFVLFARLEMLDRRMTLTELASRVDLTLANSLFSRRIRLARFVSRRWTRCVANSTVNRATCWSGRRTRTRARRRDESKSTEQCWSSDLTVALPVQTAPKNSRASSLPLYKTRAAVHSRGRLQGCRRKAPRQTIRVLSVNCGQLTTTQPKSACRALATSLGRLGVSWAEWTLRPACHAGGRVGMTASGASAGGYGTAPLSIGACFGLARVKRLAEACQSDLPPKSATRIG